MVGDEGRDSIEKTIFDGLESRVRGPRVKSPSSVEINDGELIYTLPLWVEAPTRYHRKE